MSELSMLMRRKYPGAYDDLSDEELDAKVLAKYPQYEDLAKQRTEPESEPGEAMPVDRGRMQVSRLADPEGGLALADVAGQNPKAAVGGAVAGMMAPALPATAGRLLTAAAPIIEHPATGALAGGYEGYRRGGLIGGLEGAVTGSILGPLTGRLWRARKAVGALRTARSASAAPTAAREALKDLPNTIVRSPEDWARTDQAMRLATQEAKDAGMVAAGTKAREPQSLWELILGGR